MKIKPNHFLLPTEKSIKPWDKCFLGVEGPNITERLDLSDIGIAYTDYYISRLVLTSNAQDVPLYFEGLETELVFLMVRVRKDAEHNPYYPYDDLIGNYDTLKHITYYFSDFTGNTHVLSEFFIQTGSYINKIPTIYFNNPNNFDVVLDVFGAILEKSAPTPPYTGTTYYSNLYFESIISDEFVFSGITGSTALHLLNEFFIVENIFPYTGITSVIKNIDTLTISIICNGQIYALNFLTEFDFYQAYSRIKWVMNGSEFRFLEQNYVYQNNSGYTGYDVQIPTIYIQSGMTNTLGISKENILRFFVSGVTDYWDGSLDITGATSVLTRYSNPVSLTGITEEGFYQLDISYFDNANNSKTQTILFFVGFLFSLPGSVWDDTAIWDDNTYFMFL